MGVNLSIELAPNHPSGLCLKNPVMTASGTFGYGVEYAKVVDLERLGAIVSKATTLHRRAGNPQPRLAETPAGMLNTIGLQNVGVQAVVHEKAPLWAKWKVPVVVNVAGETVDEYARIAQALEGVPGVAALELNISCPNVRSGGMAFGVDPYAAAEVVMAVRASCSLPVIPKLSPNVTNIVEIATAVVEAGADAVSLINPLVGMVIDIHARRPYLSTATGGLSGPAIRPVALRMVYAVAKEVSVPVVGVGGITSAEDALQFLMAGASAVQIGSASFVNPRAPLDVVEGLERFMIQEGIADIRDIIGAALPR